LFYRNSKTKLSKLRKRMGINLIKMNYLLNSLSVSNYKLSNVLYRGIELDQKRKGKTHDCKTCESDKTE
jgi:hypothetical protein